MQHFRGVPLLVNRLSDPDFRGRKLLLSTAIHCKKTLDHINSTLQNLTRVTSVTDVIREMLNEKNVQGIQKGHAKK